MNFQPGDEVVLIALAYPAVEVATRRFVDRVYKNGRFRLTNDGTRQFRPDGQEAGKRGAWSRAAYVLPIDDPEAQKILLNTRAQSLVDQIRLYARCLKVNGEQVEELEAVLKQLKKIGGEE